MKPRHLELVRSQIEAMRTKLDGIEDELRVCDENGEFESAIKVCGDIILEGMKLKDTCWMLQTMAYMHAVGPR